MVKEALLVGLLPHREPGTRGAPGFDDFGVRPRVGTNPLKQVKNQSVYWVCHDNLLAIGEIASLECAPGTPCGTTRQPTASRPTIVPSASRRTTSGQRSG